MPSKLKTLLIWLLAIFVVYWVITNPDRASESVRGVWEFISSVFTGVADFFTSLAE
jgi:hypothetical protein